MSATPKRLKGAEGRDPPNSTSHTIDFDDSSSDGSAPSVASASSPSRNPNNIQFSQLYLFTKRRIRLATIVNQRLLFLLLLFLVTTRILVVETSQFGYVFTQTIYNTVGLERRHESCIETHCEVPGVDAMWEVLGGAFKSMDEQLDPNFIVNLGLLHIRQWRQEASATDPDAHSEPLPADINGEYTYGKVQMYPRTAPVGLRDSVANLTLNNKRSSSGLPRSFSDEPFGADPVQRGCPAGGTTAAICKRDYFLPNSCSGTECKVGGCGDKQCYSVPPNLFNLATYNGFHNDMLPSYLPPYRLAQIDASFDAVVPMCASYFPLGSVERQDATVASNAAIQLLRDLAFADRHTDVLVFTMFFYMPTHESYAVMSVGADRLASGAFSLQLSTRTFERMSIARNMMLLVCETAITVVAVWALLRDVLRRVVMFFRFKAQARRFQRDPRSNPRPKVMPVAPSFSEVASWFASVALVVGGVVSMLVVIHSAQLDSASSDCPCDVDRPPFVFGTSTEFDKEGDCRVQWWNSLATLDSLSRVARATLAMAAVVLWLLVMYHLQFNYRFNHFPDTLRHAFTTLPSILICILIVSLGYMLAGRMMFGRQSEQFGSLRNVMVVLLGLLTTGELPGGVFNRLQHAELGFLARVYIYSYLFISWLILLNMVLAVIAGAFDHAMRSNASEVHSSERDSLPAYLSRQVVLAARGLRSAVRAAFGLRVSDDPDVGANDDDMKRGGRFHKPPEPVLNHLEAFMADIVYTKEAVRMLHDTKGGTPRKIDLVVLTQFVEAMRAAGRAEEYARFTPEYIRYMLRMADTMKSRRQREEEQKQRLHGQFAAQARIRDILEKTTTIEARLANTTDTATATIGALVRLEEVMNARVARVELSVADMVERVGIVHREVLRGVQTHASDAAAMPALLNDRMKPLAAGIDDVNASLASIATDQQAVKRRCADLDEQIGGVSRAVAAVNAQVDAVTDRVEQYHDSTNKVLADFVPRVERLSHIVTAGTVAGMDATAVSHAATQRRFDEIEPRLDGVDANLAAARRYGSAVAADRLLALHQASVVAQDPPLSSSRSRSGEEPPGPPSAPPSAR